MTDKLNVQLCYPFSEKRLATWKPPYIVQPKLNGERCRAVQINNGYVLFSRTDHLITSVPHINRQLNLLFLNSGYEFDGELYIHGMPFNEIHSIVSRKNNTHINSEQIKYYVFDIISNEIQSTRINTLKRESLKFNMFDNVKFVNFNEIYTYNEILKIYDDYLEKGYEGVIIRNAYSFYKKSRSTDIMKFKPSESDTYKIVGYKEEIDINGKPKNTLGSFICESDGNQTFMVGTGFTRDQREWYWQNKESLIGKEAEVKYQYLTTPLKVPMHPVIIRVKNDLYNT